MTFLRNVFVAVCCVILSSPAWSAACTNTVGKKECNGSYFVCNTDADCKDVKKLPSNATAGHCVSAGRNGYKICTATKCKDNYDVKGGRCQGGMITVSGTVVDSKTGEPVPFVNVQIVKSNGDQINNAGCSTDMDGKFSGAFEKIPADAQMIVSAVGYEKQTIALGKDLQIKMVPTATQLDEVQIVETVCDENTLKDLNAVKGYKGIDDFGKTVCVPEECIDLYNLRDGVCVPDDNDTALGATSETSGTDAEQNSAPESAQSQNVKPTDNSKQIADAEKAYDAAREKETSLANRMLGGATMAATGIGGMQLAQGLAEQSADAAAEADMQAYLATFTCKIGDAGGKSYKGGEMGIEVSGGNQLTSLYQQYVDLAADLKERKNALGMAPGIESTVVMDKANMGLYDATGGSGIENGTYASLYRASRGNESDQQKLAEQKDTSSNRVKGGAIAAGVGAVGGAIGDAIINSGDDDDETVTEEDCKKVKGTYKDGKCTCPGKDKVYKKGKCVDKSDSKSGLAELGASLGSSLGSSIDVGNVASMASGLMSGYGQ